MYPKVLLGRESGKGGIKWSKEEMFGRPLGNSFTHTTGTGNKFRLVFGSLIGTTGAQVGAASFLAQAATASPPFVSVVNFHLQSDYHAPNLTQVVVCILVILP